MINKTSISLELIIILALTLGILVPDWDRIPVVKDYFALLVIGELGFDLYLRLKDKI